MNYSASYVNQIVAEILWPRDFLMIYVYKLRSSILTNE